MMLFPILIRMFWVQGYLFCLFFLIGFDLICVCDCKIVNFRFVDTFYMLTLNPYVMYELVTLNIRNAFQNDLIYSKA